MKQSIIKIVEQVRIASIQLAIRSQGFSYWYKKCEEILPDISDQYTGSSVTSLYKYTNVRAMHAFQMFLFREFLSYPMYKTQFSIADFGDSSGNHSLYLKGIYGEGVRTCSYNIDSEAVTKVRKKGLIACLLDDNKWEPLFMKYDAVTAWQVFEHLTDPIGVISRIKAPYLIGSVPFVKKSRVGMHSLRNEEQLGTPEDEHIFELSPVDWTLLFSYCGWELLSSYTYYQYPFYLPFLKCIWNNDYEGFWGFVLGRRDYLY